MTPREFAAAVSILFGTPGAASAWLEIGERNVKRFMAGEKPVPVAVSEALVEEMRRQIFDEARPTPAACVIGWAVDSELERAPRTRVESAP